MLSALVIVKVGQKGIYPHERMAIAMYNSICTHIIGRQARVERSIVFQG